MLAFMAEHGPGLSQLRLTLLVRQMLEEGASQETIAAKLAMSQTMVSQIKGGQKFGGPKSIEAAITFVHLDFFFNEQIVEPHYRDYPAVGARDSTLEAETHALVSELVEHWDHLARLRQDMGRRPSDEEIGWMSHRLSFRDDRAAGLEINIGSLIDKLLLRRRQQQGRAAERPALEVVPREGRMKLAPKKAKR